MLYRHIAVAVLALGLATPPAAAFNRIGDVFLEYRAHVPGLDAAPSHELWSLPGGAGPGKIAFALAYKTVPIEGAGHLLMPTPDRTFFHDQRTVSFWDGTTTYFTLPGKGYTDIFTADTDLGELAPMRSGNLLVPERWNDRTRGAKLIEFNLQGRVAEYRFPEVVDRGNDRALGALHIELLADQCTLLYTLGNDDPAGNRVRRMNICTGQPQTDFAALLAGDYAGSIRQLPNGDVLVANGQAILQFTPAGSLRRTYSLPGVTHLALNAEGNGFWAAGVALELEFLRRYDLNAPDAEPTNVATRNPLMQTSLVPIDVSDLVIVGEWRAALTPSKSRGRAVRR